MRRRTTNQTGPDAERRRTTRPRRWALIAVTAFLAIAGCGRHDSASSSTDAATSATTSTTRTSTTVIPGLHSLPAGVTNALSLPTHILNDVQLRRNVQLTRCEATKHGWKASGTATNPATAKADYAITVFFTTSSATVIGSGVTHVRLGPRAHRTWTATGSFTPAPATSCVLRGVG
jgi:hypothetical protein